MVQSNGAAPARARHRTVDRIAAILECTARTHEGITLTGIAKRLGAPVSTVQGLVNGLVATGYLEEDERRYTLGSAPYLLNRLAGRPAVSTVTHADLEALHERTGLTAVLSIAVGPKAFYVDYCSNDPRFAYLAENYVERSLIRTSGGWLLLAGMEQRDRWAYLRALREEDHPLVDRFLAALPEIAETGICAAPHASESGDGVSIAVRENGRTVAAVGIISTHAIVGQRCEELTGILRTSATDWHSGPEVSR